jgi:hypothetical protein
MVKIFKEENKTTLVLYVTGTTQDFIIDLITTSYTSGVRIYKEYDKITVTFFDDSEETLAFIDDIVSMSYGGKDIKTIDVPGLVPVKINVETVEITGSSSKTSSHDAVLTETFKYAGMTCREALLTHGDDALIDMCCADLSTESTTLINAIKANCKNYVLGKYSNLSDEDIFNTQKDDMVSFIKKFKTLLKVKVNDILSRSSFATIEDFIQNADNILLGSSYGALTRDLTNKFK